MLFKRRLMPLSKYTQFQYAQLNCPLTNLNLSDKNSYKNRQQRKKESGQGMTEYLLIVALIALATVAVYRLLGTTISHKTAAIAQSIAENNAIHSHTAAKTAANSAAQAAGLNNQGNAPPAEIAQAEAPQATPVKPN